MNEYEVLKPFESYKVGDTVRLLERQAKYLVLNGSLRLKPKPTATTKKEQVNDAK